MGLGAIVVIGGEREPFGSTGPREIGNTLLEQPLECADVLGCSTVDRMVERLVRADVEVVSVLAQSDAFSAVKQSLGAFQNVEVQIVSEPYAAIVRKLNEYASKGVEHSFIISGDAYAETDLLDLFYFHREAKQAATRTIDREGPLELWVVDSLKAQQSNFEDLLNDRTRASYFIREYVSRLRHARDLRRFASDILRGRCMTRPKGHEIRRGIWMDDGAEVHRRARIVAPAYVGRASKVMEDTLITRFSSIEKGCCIDYGTVIENSSILENTQVGICLDVCHAVANGNKLLSLGHDVVVEISDPSVLRFNSLDRKQARDRKRVLSSLFSRRKEGRQILPELQTASASAPERCGFEPNPIQG